MPLRTFSTLTIDSPVIYGGTQFPATNTNEKPFEDLSARLESMGWSRAPACSWVFADRDGTPRCAYTPLAARLRVLEAARYISFDQTYIDRAFENWREHGCQEGSQACTPGACPNRVTRFLESLHPKRAASLARPSRR